MAKVHATGGGDWVHVTRQEGSGSPYEVGVWRGRLALCLLPWRKTGSLSKSTEGVQCLPGVQGGMLPFVDLYSSRLSGCMWSLACHSQGSGCITSI